MPLILYFHPVHDIQFLPLSENAWLLMWPAEINMVIHAEVMQVKRWLDTHPLPGLRETVPAYQSLAVFTDPAAIMTDDKHWLQQLSAAVDEALQAARFEEKKTDIIEIPVCYETEMAPDLQEVAEQKGLSPAAIIQLHSSITYEVMMMGFTPGFAYMGILPQELITRRRSSPRLKVPAGSVAIAGQQTGIYPFETPGGWNIIGRTPLTLFQRNAAQPFLLQPGSKVIFKPISLTSFNALAEIQATSTPSLS